MSRARRVLVAVILGLSTSASAQTRFECSPLERVGERDSMAGDARYVIVAGPSGAIEYLHAGGRSLGRRP